MSSSSGGSKSSRRSLKTIFRFLSSGSRFKFSLLLVLIIALILLLIVYIIQPNLVKVRVGAGELIINKIEASNGSIAIQSSGKNQNSVENAVLMVSASGSRDEVYSPWVRTGIDVKPNDTINIQASGSVHTALKKLIVISQTDMAPNPEQYQSWSTPEGYVKRHNDWEAKRKDLKLVPEAPYGRLVAAVWDKENPVPKETRKAIGTKYEFKIKHKGELVLAVNDSLLAIDKKNLYVYPNNDVNKPLYDVMLKEINGDAINSWSEKKIIEEREKLYLEKEKAWTKIEQYGNWTVWFDDNIGEFFVSITKSPA